MAATPRDNSPRLKGATIPPALPPPVRGAIDAANRGDTETFVESFLPHVGVVDDWGRQFHGAAEIRRWSDKEFIGKNVLLKVIHYYITDHGETVVIAHVGGRGFNGPGTFSFDIKEERIARMRITA